MEPIILNKPAPSWMRDAFRGVGTGGMLRLADQLIMLKIDDFTPADLKGLRGKVQVRVYRGRTVLLIHLLQSNFAFELWWSPVIGRLNGEPPLEADWEHHPVVNIVAMDKKLKVRNLRSATLSPEVAVAISRAMSELLATPCTDRDVQLEIQALIALHQGRFPDGMFHAACNLGD
ncbi:MAG: hypothetical protein KC466_00530 [Myxococcales bacterium]|nr:hypothetical protein [Myxococcales bacterium]